MSTPKSEAPDAESLPTTGQELSRVRGAFRDVFRHKTDAKLTASGRVVLLHLRKYCAWQSTAYTFGDPTGLAMAFKDGRRSVYLEIQRVLNLSDETIMKLNQPGDIEGEF